MHGSVTCATDSDLESGFKCATDRDLESGAEDEQFYQVRRIDLF